MKLIFSFILIIFLSLTVTTAVSARENSGILITAVETVSNQGYFSASGIAIDTAEFCKTGTYISTSGTKVSRGKTIEYITMTFVCDDGSGSFVLNIEKGMGGKLTWSTSILRGTNRFTTIWGNGTVVIDSENPSTKYLSGNFHY